MPTHYRVFNDGRVVVERWSGRIAHEDLTRHLMRRFHDTTIRPDASVLSDGRLATFETSEELAPSVADTHLLPDGKTRGWKVALVVNSDVLVRANLFAARAADHGVNIMVFEHFDVACLWLEISPTAGQQMLDDLDAGPDRTKSSKSG